MTTTLRATVDGRKVKAVVCMQSSDPFAPRFDFGHKTNKDLLIEYHNTYEFREIMGDLMAYNGMTHEAAHKQALIQSLEQIKRERECAVRGHRLQETLTSPDKDYRFVECTRCGASKLICEEVE